MLNAESDNIKIFRPAQEHAESFDHLLFRSFRPYLLHCGQRNIVAVAAETEGGEPCGLGLALTVFDRDGTLREEWTLLSIFVSENCRKKGVGTRIWEEMRNDLASAGCRHLQFQSVLRETTADAVGGFLSSIGFSEPKRIARIFGFSTESIQRSVFVKGSMAENFKPDEGFSFRTFDGLTAKNLAEIEANEGEWYPPFVNPLIGREQYNDKCTLFAVDPLTERVAGWITVLNVNNNTRLLYRTFFTRAAYRNTPVGFHLFTEAIKNNLKYYPERCGLSSIPTGNEKAMRFSELFFKDAVDYISHEISAEYCFPKPGGA